MFKSLLSRFQETRSGWRLALLLGALLGSQAAFGQAEATTAAPTASGTPGGPTQPAAPAQRAPASSAGDLSGLWKGPLQLPGGKLEVIFRLVQLTGGEYFATLDVPLQKVQHLDVAVAQHADTVELLCPQASVQFTARLGTGAQSLSGTWRQPGFTGPLTLALSAPAAPLPPPRLTPPYREEEILFTNPAGGVVLSATLTVPPGPGPFAAVALLSDAGAQDRNGKVEGFAPLGQLADYLTRRGVAVLRYDDRGVGQSTGDFKKTTLTEHVADAQAALAFMRTRPELNPAQLGLLGHGEGGNVALLAATQPLPPAFVVALAPYGLTGAEVAVQQQQTVLRSVKADPQQIALTVKRQQLMFDIIRQTPDDAQAQAIVANMLRQNSATLDEAGARASAAEMVSPRFRFLLDFNPTANLGKVSCPVLLLYGQADPVVSPDPNLNALLKGLGANKHVLARRLPGVNHLFQADPSQWPLVSGQPKPTFSPAAAGSVRTFIASQAAR